MTDAELHIALREVVDIGRRVGYDADEIAEALARVVRDYAAHQLRRAADESAHTGFTDWLFIRADSLAAGGSEIKEAKKAAHHDREQIAYLEKKLDIAERALRGLGLVFE